MPEELLTSPIAVVGLACWYPDARNPLQLWENVLSRRRQFRQLPDQRLSIDDYYHPDPHESDKTYAKKAAVIDGFDFDWASMRIPYSTYQSTDITHWLALQVAIEAVTDAGYSSKDIPGDLTGVIVGNSLTGEQARANTMRLRWPYVHRAFLAAAHSKGLAREQIVEIEAELEICFKSAFPKTSEDTLAGSLSNTIAGRICNYMDLHGGGYTVDGACSSSLLAVSTAASRLVHGELDIALAGGVDISLDSFELIGFAKTRALTQNDVTKAVTIAEKQGIRAYRLKVFNGFHSKLAKDASDILRSDTLLPKKFTESTVKLFSAVKGKEIKPGISLQNHFADQVIFQVDFITMVKSMAAECDIFVEVGPGGVVSGLFKSIAGIEGPLCMPVESTSERDKDLNTMLAVIFTQGVDISWKNLYVQHTTWVRILEHGKVKPAPYPDYYWEFIKSPHVMLLPQKDAPNTPEPLFEPLQDLIMQCEQDKELYAAPVGPIVQPLLCEQIIETSLENSNLVGNIYFANYYSWQGQTRDRYFYNLVPECFRGIGDQGELLCLACRVDHLREAMPFDRIFVTMALKKLNVCSAVFYFEYFRIGRDEKRTKLAFGEQHAVWVIRDDKGNPVPAPFPVKVKKDFQRLTALVHC